MMPTGSGLLRASMCAPSQVYPQVNSSNECALWGTIGHRFAQLIPTMGEEKALAASPEWARDRLQQIQLDGLPLDPKVYRQEVAYAYNVATGKSRYLGAGLDRKYGTLDPDEIACTLDVVGDLGGERCSVEDYKFEGYESYAPSPDVNPQLNFGALCLERLAGGGGSYELALIHIKPDGSHWREATRRDVDCFDLDAFASRLKEMVERVRSAEAQYIAGKTLSVSRGHWCRFCPALVHCPAVLSLIHAAAAKPEATVEELRVTWASSGVGDLEQRRAAAALAYERIQAFRSAAKELSTALWMFASEHDIVLPDGRVYGSVERSEDQLDARVARTLIGEKYSPDAADLAVTFETSKAGIERALRGVWAKQLAAWRDAVAHGSTDKKPTLAGMMRDLLGDLQKRGGIKTRLKRQTRLHRKAGTEVVVEAGSSSEEEAPF